MALFAGLIIYLIVGSIIMAMVAVLLKFAAKWVEELSISFANSFITTFLAWIVGIVLGLFVQMVTSAGPQSTEAANVASLLMLPTGFVIHSAFVSNRFQIPFGRACLVMLAVIGMVFTILLAVGGYFALTMILPRLL
jgi:hypothetical protein